MKSEVWSPIYSRLKQTLEEGTFNVWIAPLKARTSPGTLLVLSAPNSFVASWVSSKLKQKIAEAAQAELGRRISIRIETEAETAQSNASREPLPVPQQTQKRASSKKSTQGVSQTHETPSSVQEQKVPEAGSSEPHNAPRFEQLAFPIKLKVELPKWKYDFSSFVVGQGNDMAFAAAQNVARENSQVSTLFLSAGPGLGKTHLTQAVGAELSRLCNHDAPRIEYLTAESFAQCYVQAARAHDFDQFKRRFHNADVLLLEDVHFLSGKEKIQIELLSAIKALQESGKRIVLTSSFSPRELANVDSSLVSRFSSGFLVNIEKPDFDTRRRILFEKARLQHVLLPENIADAIAEQLTGDVRQMESCLANLLLQSQMRKANPTLEMTWEILSRYAEVAPFINIESITRRVCEAFSLTPAQLCAKSRKTIYVQARNTIFYLARKHTDLSLEAIGEHFSRRHSTVLKGIATIERDLAKETSEGRQIAHTIELIEAHCK